MTMLTVRAVAQGFDGMNLREPGDVFTMPVGSEAPWFEVIDAAAEPTKTDEKGTAS